MNGEKNILDISWETLFKIGVFIALMYFFYIIRDLIIWFILALIIAVIIEPILKILKRAHIPRIVGAILIYTFLFVGIGLFLYLTIPFVISEVFNFSKTAPKEIPSLLEKISPILKPFGFEISKNLKNILDIAQDKLVKSGGNIFNSLSSLFGGALALIFTIFVAIFLSLEEDVIEKILRIFTPRKYEDYIANLWERSQQKVVGWFLIRIIGVVFVGSLSFLLFYFSKVNYPVLLSLIGGLFDFVPIIGPTTAALIILGMGSLGGLTKGLLALLFYGIVELLENIIIFPVLSQRIIKISPVLVLVALFIGGKIWGILGAVLAVPLIAILYEVMKDFFKERKDHLFSS